MIKLLEDTSIDLLTCFKNNEMKVNADKCHLLVSSKEKLYDKLNHMISKAVSNKSS